MNTLSGHEENLRQIFNDTMFKHIIKLRRELLYEQNILCCFEHNCVVAVNEEQWWLSNVILAAQSPPNRGKEPYQIYSPPPAMMLTM